MTYQVVSENRNHKIVWRIFFHVFICWFNLSEFNTFHIWEAFFLHANVVIVRFCNQVSINLIWFQSNSIFSFSLNKLMANLNVSTMMNFANLLGSSTQTLMLLPKCYDQWVDRMGRLSKWNRWRFVTSNQRWFILCNHIWSCWYSCPKWKHNCHMIEERSEWQKVYPWTERCIASNRLQLY